MKKEFKPAIILSIVASFMFFIFEPVTMYANNTSDFWFDFYTLIGPALLFFVGSTLFLLFVFLVLYFVAKRIKKIELYRAAIFLFTFGFICAYIHSNFLSGFLPPLDGTVFEWGDPAANIVSIVVCVVVAAAIIAGRIFLGSEKLAKYSSYVSLAIFAMLGLSLFSTCLTTPVFDKKGIATVATTDNLYTVSSDRNFFVFLVDAVDSTNFDKIIQGSDEYKKVLKDFSYFPDTLSGYAFTRDSIPFIFSGKWNENEKDFVTYSTEAYDNSSFFNKLAEDGWQREFYDEDYTWNSDKALGFDNLIAISKKPSALSLMKQELKYILFKTLPFPLKRFSKIDTASFSTLPEEDLGDKEPFQWLEYQFYLKHLGRTADKTDKKLFQYIHLEGAHVPFDIDADLNDIPDKDGTYPQKLEATMKITASYFDYLKKNDAYDNATIVLMADHGFWYEGTNRQNPILYIKGPHEQHDSMLVSDKQVSYEDLCNTFTELLDGRASTDIFSNIPSEGRTRRFLFNEFLHEEHMIEYIQTGKAWDLSTFNTSGRSFDL